MVEGQDRTRESFQRLATAELPALYWLARRLVRDGAEDLVQEALLRAYRSFGTLRQDTAAGPWLKCILVNVFRDQLRRQARSVEELPVEEVEDFSLYQTLIEQDPLPYSDTLHHDYLRAFGNEDVREVLLRLPELYRAPLVLRYMDGFATKEKVEQHLSFCRTCCGELEFAKELRGFLATQGAEELPPHVQARLERFLADL